MEGYQNFQEKLDIKILILFVLRRLPDAVTRETLTDLALSEGNAGYFEYSECLAELVDSHQVEQEGNLYKISERGARNGEIVESSLPMTVRQKMEKNILVKLLKGLIQMVAVDIRYISQRFFSIFQKPLEYFV